MPKNRHVAAPPSDHFDGVRFFNPGQPVTDRALSEGLRWKLAERPAGWPTTVPIERDRPDTAPDQLTITMVGHATLLIHAGGVMY